MSIKDKVKELETSYNISKKSEDELNYITNLLKIENEDKKDDHQRLMTWVCLIGMLVYPLLVIITNLLNLDDATKFISEMSDLYFLTTSAIVMTFFGVNTISKIKSKEKDS